MKQPPLIFRDWLLGTAHAPGSAAARLRQDVIGEEKRLEKQFQFTERHRLAQYCRVMPPDVAPTKEEVAALWRQFVVAEKDATP